jgi:thioredoxin 1
MQVDATVETFPGLVEDGVVLVDFWGPNCAPCLSLMPHVEALVHRLGERVRLVKVNAPENRQICRDLRVFGLPTYLVFDDSEEVERLSGDPSLEDLEAALGRAMGGE